MQYIVQGSLHANLGEECFANQGEQVEQWWGSLYYCIQQRLYVRAHG
jgi:hypothetical protein